MELSSRYLDHQGNLVGRHAWHIGDIAEHVTIVHRTFPFITVDDGTCHRESEYLPMLVATF